MSPSLTVDHVVIAVLDMEAATADYTALLGRRPSWRGEHPLYGTRNTLFRIENTYVELLGLTGTPGDPRWAGELARFYDTQGEGLFALALGTRDIDVTVADARERGLEVLDPAFGDGVDALTGKRREWRNAQVQLKSSHGVRVFFIEHGSPPDALPVAPPVGQEPSTVRRMDHAVVLSADLEAARRVWEDALGVRLALDRTFPERNSRILFFRLGDITVEVSGAATQSEEGFGKPDRLWGIAWGVDDLRATCQRLMDAGINVSDPRPGIKPGTFVATAKGPSTHGVPTLFIEHTPESFRQESRRPQGMAYDNAPERRAFTAKALDHLVVSTSDIQATAQKWADTLGLRAEPAYEPEGARFLLGKLPAGNSFVELVQPLTEDHRIATTIAERGQGMFSISIEVDDLEAAVVDLRAKGATVSDIEPGVFPNTRVARINKAGTNGVSMQLIQRG